MRKAAGILSAEKIKILGKSQNKNNCLARALNNTNAN
jgi:hypothetical protein